MTSSAAISGGTVASADTGVVVVGVDSFTSFCSAVVLAPNLVLAPRRCVTPGATATCGTIYAAVGPTSGLSIYSGTTVDSSSSPIAAVTAIQVTGTTVCRDDLAVLVLDRNLSGSVAAPMSPSFSAPAVGQTYDIIGYGATDSAGSGLGTRRRRNGLSVSCAASCSVDNLWIGGAGACEGDSGGPALDSSGKVFGTIFGGTITCDANMFTSLATNAEWLKQRARDAATAGGYAAPSWAAASPSDAGADAGSSTDATTDSAPDATTDSASATDTMSTADTASASDTAAATDSAVDSQTDSPSPGTPDTAVDVVDDTGAVTTDVDSGDSGGCTMTAQSEAPGDWSMLALLGASFAVRRVRRRA